MEALTRTKQYFKNIPEIKFEGRDSKNPFAFMDLQDVQELANFFERRVSAYQVAVAGDVSFNEAF